MPSNFKQVVKISELFYLLNFALLLFLLVEICRLHKIRYTVIKVSKYLSITAIKLAKTS